MATSLYEYQSVRGDPRPRQRAASFDVDVRNARYASMMPEPGVEVRKKKLKLGLGFVARAALRLFKCCLPSGMEEDMVDDLRIVQRVHEEMLVVDVADKTDDEITMATLNPTPALAQDVRGNLIVLPHKRRAAVQPKFVAQLVVALRMRLGLGACDPNIPGNRELVRREIAKIMRERNVRAMDASVHLRWVERCFFEEFTHDRLPDWRARAVSKSRLVRWLFNDNQPQYDY